MRKLSLVLSLVFFHLILVGQRNIVGVVTTTTGEPLVGVNVIAEGSAPIIGTNTDFDGKYELIVPEIFTELKFSYTGFQSQVVPIGVTNTVNVVLMEGVDLDQVIITGLGISREEKALGYALSKVGGDDISRSHEVNFIQSLAAKVTGLQITQSSGTPGASSKITLRGNNSLICPNQPLVLVDGVPYNNVTQSSTPADNPYNPTLEGVNNSNRGIDLNTHDIESVNVLKGPGAAILYGSRAANGVILINTKKGKAGQKNIKITAGSSLSLDIVNRLPALQNRFAQGDGGGRLDPSNPSASIEDGTFNTFALDNNATNKSWGPTIGSSGANSQLYSKAFDHYDNFFKAGITLDNNFSIQGGVDNAVFRLAFNNIVQNGIVPNTSLNRNSLRFSATAGNDRLSVNATTAIVNTQTQKAQNGANLSGIMSGITRAPASFNLLGGDGSHGYETVNGRSHQFFSTYDNPHWSAYKNQFEDNNIRITSGVNIEYKLKSWITFRWNLGIDHFTDQRKQVFHPGAFAVSPANGELWENTKTWLEVNSDIMILAKRNLTEDLSLAITLGNNLNQRNDKDIFARGRDLSTTNFFNLSNANDRYNSESTIVKRLAGYYFDIGFGYKSLLYMNLSGRHDWSSTFGSNLRKSGVFYPAASMSFVFSELLPDNKLKDIFAFDKIRFAYAQTGLEPTPYLTRPYFTQPSFGDGFGAGLSFPYLGQNGFAWNFLMGDDGLKPEVMTGIEAGLNLRFLKGRINLDVAFYQQTTDNLLVYKPVSAATGFSAQMANAGSMRNQGIELEFNAEIIKKKNANWNLSLQFTKNVNQVRSISPTLQQFEIEETFDGISAQAIVGQPYGTFYGTRWLRSPSGQIVVNNNGLPIENPTQGILGNPTPDFLASFKNELNIKAFSLSFLWDFKKGGHIWNGTQARLNALGASEASESRSVSYIIPGVVQTGTDPGGNPTYAQNTTPVSAHDYFSTYLGDGSGSVAESAIQDGSWIRLRELSLSYNIPIKNFKVFKKVHLFVSGRNLFLWTPYTGVDPETSLTGAGSNINGLDFFNMPSTKSFVMGINAEF